MGEANYIISTKCSVIFLTCVDKSWEWIDLPLELILWHKMGIDPRKIFATRSFGFGGNKRGALRSWQSDWRETLSIDCAEYKLFQVPTKDRSQILTASVFAKPFCSSIFHISLCLSVGSFMQSVLVFLLCPALPAK